MYVRACSWMCGGACACLFGILFFFFLKVEMLRIFCQAPRMYLLLLYVSPLKQPYYMNIYYMYILFGMSWNASHDKRASLMDLANLFKAEIVDVGIGHVTFLFAFYF